MWFLEAVRLVQDMYTILLCAISDARKFDMHKHFQVEICDFMNLFLFFFFNYYFSLIV